MGWRPSASQETLRARAEITARVRRFFGDRGVLEVDTPVLQGGANLDHGVVPFRLGDRFLPTSPEHALKRLVAAGYGPVWTLAPAFRQNERGRRHGPEFRMLEWYRPGWDDRQMAEETIAALECITGLGGGVERLSWHDAFQRIGVEPETVQAAEGFSREERLDLLLVERIEPTLGRGRWTVLCDYPASGAAQARVRTDAAGRPVAARFEIYRDGVELANGYHECVDAAELKARHVAELAGRPNDCLDRRFHDMMSDGFPDCAGVAVGFDRAVMLALGIADIAQVQAFAWDIA